MGIDLGLEKFLADSQGEFEPIPQHFRKAEDRLANLNRVSKELSQRWHSCPHCGNEIDRDTNAAILIKKVGLGIASLKNARRAGYRLRQRFGEKRTL